MKEEAMRFKHTDFFYNVNCITDASRIQQVDSNPSDNHSSFYNVSCRARNIGNYCPFTLQKGSNILGKIQQYKSIRTARKDFKEQITRKLLSDGKSTNLTQKQQTKTTVQQKVIQNFCFQYADVSTNDLMQPENQTQTERGLTYLAPGIQKTGLADIWPPNDSNLKKRSYRSTIQATTSPLPITSS